jgi:hypothetical protein
MQILRRHRHQCLQPLDIQVMHHLLQKRYL